MRILFFGDVVGRSGLAALSFFLPRLKEKTKADFLIVNGENSAPDGRGMGYQEFEQLYGLGADCVTLGNHFDRKKSILAHLDGERAILRPAGWEEEARGASSRVYSVDGVPIRVSNLLGRGLMDREYASPFTMIDRILKGSDEKIHLVDFHAESTSEKALFANYLDGKVSAVIGTHTHVMSADSRILPSGTAFITDVGMNGDPDGIIGFDVETALGRFVYGKETHLTPGQGKRLMANAVLLDIDEGDGHAKSIEPISLIEEGEKR